MNLQDTIAAISTPPGQGAIAVIRLSGAKSFEIANKAFHGKDLKKQESHTIHFGKISKDKKVLDEVMVSLFKSPKSYTGEDAVEISCHGSTFIQNEILQYLVELGARTAQPGEYTLRAFLNGKLDLSEAEAVADLIASNSAASHEQALQQMKGGISQKISELREKLLKFTALIELELDFSEEDVEFADRKDLKQLIKETRKLFQSLITSFKYGNAIKDGIPVVIAGKPNAGKSTLLNVLVNDERAIVSEIPGTTRDTIEEIVNINNISYRFVDTAGIRDAKDKIEAMGIDKTMQQMQRAQIILYLFDANKTNEAQLKKEVEKLNLDSKSTLLVATKTDKLKNKLTYKLKNIVPISAKTEKNIDKLLKAMQKTATRALPQTEGVSVSNTRHYELLRLADHALSMVESGIKSQQPQELLAIEIKRALQFLGQITGEVTTEDVLGEIFSNFCIGK